MSYRASLRLLSALVMLLSAQKAAQAQERVLLTPEPAQTLAEQSDVRVQGHLQALRDQANEFGRVRVIVGLRTPFAAEGHLNAATAAQQRSEMQSMQARVLSSLPASAGLSGNVTRFATIPFMAISVTPEELDLLQQSPEVISIQKDKTAKPTLNLSVPYLGGDTAWSQGFSGAGQTVAVLDTGVDKSHPFLAGKVVAEACYSTPDIAQGEASLCPGGVTSSTAPGSGVNCTGADGCDHGTHVAGIVAGKVDSLSGVAKEASLISIQVFHKVTNSTECDGRPPCARTYNSDYIKGLERILALKNTYNIAAVNMSLGASRYNDQAVCDADNLAAKSAIDNLRSVGIATIASSGNEEHYYSMGEPACISSVVSVGSTWVRSGENYWSECGKDSDILSTPDKITCFSNSASFLSLLAPGSKIDSSVPGGIYKMFSGTSMASPHVAGAWAVLKQKQPTANVPTLLNALTQTGTYILDPRNGISKPRINIDQALQFLSDAPAPKLYSSVLPYARAAQVVKPVTAFTNAVNDGAVASENCAPSVPVGTDTYGTFSYQTTDANNQLIGTPNTPASIPAGKAQNFLIALTPSQTFAAIELPIIFKCTNALPTPVFPGVNTFALSSSATATPDLVAIGVTPSHDGIVTLPSNTGTGFFATAAINIGAAGTILATASDQGRGLPLTLQLCETKANGETITCGNNLVRNVATNETLYYSIFATGTGQAIPFDPAVNRLFLFLVNASTGIGLYGATNVAVTAP